MARNSFGHLFRITTFGESHGPAMGVVIDGCPAGIALEEADISAELERRRPGQSAVTTDRKEADQPHILSGVFEGVTTVSCDSPDLHDRFRNSLRAWEPKTTTSTSREARHGA